jgi:hypothetical protein
VVRFFRDVFGHWAFDVVPPSGGSAVGQQCIRAGAEIGYPAPQKLIELQGVQGAWVGDLYMSLIQNCRLDRENPFEYLLACAQRAGCSHDSRSLVAVELSEG